MSVDSIYKENVAMENDAGTKDRLLDEMNDRISFRYDHVRPKAQVPTPVQPVSFPVNPPVAQNFPTTRIPAIDRGGMTIEFPCK